MNCKQATSVFLQHIENHIDNDTSAQLANHLSQCTSCQKQYTFIKEAFGSVENQQHFNPEVSWFFTEKTFSKIKSLNNSEISTSSWIYNVIFRKASVLSASAAALIVGVVLGIFLSTAYYKSTNTTSTAEIQTVEEVYFAGTSNDYMMEFFDNQYYKENGNE